MPSLTNDYYPTIGCSFAPLIETLQYIILSQIHSAPYCSVLLHNTPITLFGYVIFPLFLFWQFSRISRNIHREYKAAGWYGGIMPCSPSWKKTWALFVFIFLVCAKISKLCGILFSALSHSLRLLTLLFPFQHCNPLEAPQVWEGDCFSFVLWRSFVAT